MLLWYNITISNLERILMEPNQSMENIMAAGSTKKNSKGMLVGLTLCLILAAGGIGFGVWAMTNGDS